MDGLKLLKKDWKENQKFPKLSKLEIYALLQKKSSSIVKLIFILSLVEFGFWTIIGLFLKDNEAQQRFDSYEMDHITLPLIVVSYLVLAYFFVMFYKNHKKISSTDNVKSLMENILKTRKTVKHYVLFNLVFIYILLIVGVLIEINNNPDFQLVTSKFSETGDFLLMYGIIALLTLLLMVVLTAILLGFYYLVYGILLKRLKKNYKILQEIEE